MTNCVHAFYLQQRGIKIIVLVIAIFLFSPLGLPAQFHYSFDEPTLDGWRFFSGDGEAAVNFIPGNGYASIIVDATRDKRNIWWAVIQRTVSDELDLSKLSLRNHELRIEARIRTSHAPRRVNLHLHTQRTTDFHTHLMEFDIPDTTGWHTISMTTADFRASPGDLVNGQLALMDWGTGRYRVDVDYFRVEVLDTDTIPPDKGEQVLYPPPVPDPNMFSHRIVAFQDGMVDLQYPEVNFGGWHAPDGQDRIPLVSVNGSQITLLRWDLDAFKERRPEGYGMLELTTHSVQKTEGSGLKEFDRIRLVEILGGEKGWERHTVTLQNIMKYESLETVFNPQMIIDVDINEEPGGKTYIHIPRSVIRRLLAGSTGGIAIRPLGAIHVNLFSGDFSGGKYGAALYFNLDRAN